MGSALRHGANSPTRPSLEFAFEVHGSFAQSTLTERDPDQPGSTYESTFSIDGEFSVKVEAEPQSGRAIEASAGR